MICNALIVEQSRTKPNGSWSDSLARKHSLDLKRVHRVVLRTAVDDYGRPLPLPKPGHDTYEYGLRFAPSLNEALAFLPPEDAKRVLERNSDALLATGYSVTSFAASPWLDWRLGLLSPTKVPVDAFRLSAGLNAGYSDAVGHPPVPHGPRAGTVWVAQTGLPGAVGATVRQLRLGDRTLRDN